jgi:hypothetical protein
MEGDKVGGYADSLGCSHQGICPNAGLAFPDRWKLECGSAIEDQFELDGAFERSLELDT